MKIPPKAKIYEAFSALADERVMIEDQTAKVKSSNLKKEYSIKWNDHQISSDDNATFWQGYPGYPVIAVWLKTKMISYDEDIVKHFGKINWNELNKKNNRDYDKGVNEILNKLAEENINTEYIEEQVDSIYEKIKEMPYEIVRKIK